MHQQKLQSTLREDGLYKHKALDKTQMWVPLTLAKDIVLPYDRTKNNGSSNSNTSMPQNSFEAYCAARQQALAETSRGARAGLEVARAMVCDTSPALMEERINGRPHGNAEQFLLAWRREKTRAERAEVLCARRSSAFLRKVRE